MEKPLTKQELALLARAVLYLPTEWKEERERYEALSLRLIQLALETLNI